MNAIKIQNTLFISYTTIPGYFYTQSFLPTPQYNDTSYTCDSRDTLTCFVLSVQTWNFFLKKNTKKYDYVSLAIELDVKKNRELWISVLESFWHFVVLSDLDISQVLWNRQFFIDYTRDILKCHASRSLFNLIKV